MAGKAQCCSGGSIWRGVAPPAAATAAESDSAYRIDLAGEAGGLEASDALALQRPL
jgi:hypothetical protein